MAKKKAKPKSSKPVPFEQSLEQLKLVVGELENGNLTLSDSLEKYEQGIASLKQCYEALNQAQRKIELLVDLDEEGNLVTRPFDNTSSLEASVGVRRDTSDRSHDTVVEDGDDDEGDENYGDEEYEDMDDPNSLF